MALPALLVITVLCSVHGTQAASLLRGKPSLVEVKDALSSGIEERVGSSMAASQNDMVLGQMALGMAVKDKVVGLIEEVKKFEQNPQRQQQSSGMGWGDRVLIQLIFGLIYYFLIVSKYPKMDGLKPTPKAVELQEMNEISATMEASLPNCLLSWCCTGPRAAHTFHSAGVLDYWPGCILMSLLPCCTLWAVNSFTDLNERLGGAQKNFFMGALCACCCSCCVVAQDAQSLDYITNVDTRLCGVQAQ